MGPPKKNGIPLKIKTAGLKNGLVWGSKNKIISHFFPALNKKNAKKKNEKKDFV